MACEIVPHQPRLARVLNGDPPRRLLGLPDRYVQSTLASAVAQRLPRHAGSRPAELVQTLADATAAPEDRLAAGQYLALLGDPRLQTLAPPMVTLPAASAGLGLDEAALDATLARWQALGVERDWLRKELPRHVQALPAYRIALHPVTHQEYRDFLQDSGQPRLPRSWRLGRYPQEWSNHPVHGIRPEDADAYAMWLAGRTGRAFRLPSEAEWEHAAAGPEGREFPWGADFDHRLANTAELGLLGTTPVGCFPGGAAWCGALDLAGNVEEYVSDGYRPYPGGPLVQDDLYRLDPAHRVARGGSFARFADLARTRRRHGAIDTNEVYVMGFRLAEDIR